jgi:hypothetical protein
MGLIIDLTEQMPAAPQPTPTRTTVRTQDWAAMVAAAEGPKPVYVPEYEFSGRTFTKRDILLNPR